MEGETLLKKNQLALILLTLVLMLTVYYITNPFEKDKVGRGSIDETSGRIEELTARRVALREERNPAFLVLTPSSLVTSQRLLKRKTH